LKIPVSTPSLIPLSFSKVCLTLSSFSLLILLSLGSTLAIENEHAVAALAAATDLIRQTDFNNIDEKSTRRLIGELQAEIVCDMHRIQFLLKHCTLLTDWLHHLQRSLEYSQMPAVDRVE
jgi:hypothetical protein